MHLPKMILSGTVVLLTAIVAIAQQPVDDARLRTVGETGDDWLSYGLTPGETRYSPLDQIDTENVSRLGLAWAYDIGEGGGNQEGTLLEWNDTLYGITNWSVVYAVDARTGEEVWRWDPQVNRETTRAVICCGIVNRGIAIYGETIIAPSVDGRLWALDAYTGRPVWESRVSYTIDHYSLTMAPRIAGGNVIIGAAGGEYPVRGFFAAFDAETGDHQWTFYTVPGNPADGFENDAMRMAAETWSGEWWRLGGGAPVWDAISYDPEEDLVYVGTGNGGPWPESLRQSEGLDNLFVASIIAVRGATGEYVWHYQPVPGDSWDYDSVQHLLLADMTIDGRERKVIMQANKDGFYYVIDRLTGAFISAEPFSYVTWAQGIDQETGRPIINPEAHYDRTGQRPQLVADVVQPQHGSDLHSHDDTEQHHSRGPGGLRIQSDRDESGHRLRGPGPRQRRRRTPGRAHPDAGHRSRARRERAGRSGRLGSRQPA
jgi:quinohemoprotein ethanol dehydrogenase